MKKIISLIIISTLVFSSCAKVEVLEKKYFKTYTVWEWYISSNDSILATVEWMNVSDLSFKNPWRIKEIFVKKWDTVKSGQILAILSNEEANISYAWLENILHEVTNMWIDISWIWNDTVKIKSALWNMYDGKIKLLENDYNKSKINISMSKKDLDLAKTNLDNNSQIFSWTSLSNDQKIKQAENALEMAKNNLENSKILLDSDKVNIQKNAISSLNNAYILARDARDYIDVNFGYTPANEDKNNSYEYLLWAKNNNSLNKAEDSFYKFNTGYNETYKLYNDLIVNNNNITKDDLINTLNKSLITLESLRINLHDEKDVLDNSISSINFSDDTINGIKNQISTFLWNLEQIILSPSWAWVKWSIEAIESFDNNYNLKIKQLEDAVNISAQDVNLAKTGKDISSSDISKNIENLKSNISMKEDSLQIAKIQEEQANKIIDLTKQEKVSKLAEIDAKLAEIKSKVSEAWSKKAEVQMNANMALNNINSWIITAPFDWIILDKIFDIWAVVWAWTPIFKLSSTEWKYLKINIDNNNYGLTLWNIINLKSEISWKTLTWSIINIDNNNDLISNKNYTEIKINDSNIKIWDRLIAMLWKEKQKKQIIIPLNSIINKYSEPWVYIVQNGYTKFQIIKTKESDEEFIAVDWLKIWDKIITEWKDNLLDWEKLD